MSNVEHINTYYVIFCFSISRLLTTSESLVIILLFLIYKLCFIIYVLFVLISTKIIILEQLCSVVNRSSINTIDTTSLKY